MCNQFNEYERLSDRELLGLFVSETAADRLLKEYGNLEEVVLHTYPEQLEKLKGIGNKRSSQIQALNEISYRIFNRERKKLKIIKTPTDIYRLNKDMQSFKQEVVRVIMLDIKNQVRRVENITIGTTNSSILTPKEVYSKPLIAMAAAIILVHNHPSGIPEPSRDDINITKKIIKAGEILNIELLDHVLIGHGSYYSMREHRSLEWG